MFTLRHLFATTAATGLAVCLAGLPVAALQNDKAKDDEAKRPKIRMRAQPQVSMAPSRITFSVELQGGADDFEEYYCAGVEWEWGDDTSSESTTDCEPYEAGKSTIKRRYTVQHQFRRPGTYKVYFHLKNKSRILGSGTATVQVRPGASSGPF